MGHRIVDLAPRLHRLIPKRRVHKRTVLEALSNHSWISDIQGTLTVGVITDYLSLWDLIHSIQLRQYVADTHVFVLLPMAIIQQRQHMKASLLGRRLLNFFTEYGEHGHHQRKSSFYG
jgi:hypothetical protein